MRVGHVDSPLIGFRRLNYKGIYWPFSIDIQKNVPASSLELTNTINYRTKKNVPWLELTTRLIIEPFFILVS